MGLIQKGLETFNFMEHLAGVLVEGKQPLAPVGHMLANASIEVTIDEEGRFVSAKEIEDKVVIPCTEPSASRSGAAIFPHPLCDNIGYLSGQSQEKYDAYVEQLKRWIDSGCRNTKVIAVHAYVSRKSLIQDLQSAEIKKIKDQDLIVWRVVGLGLSSGRVSEDIELQKEYTSYYLSVISNATDSRKDYCMVTGKETIVTSKHLKGVVAFHGNAKIISSNDKKNYTYLGRGRFIDTKDSLCACSVSYLASQKAHNALQWIAANEGISLGDRRCVCWNPSGKSIPDIDKPLMIEEDLKPKVSEYKEMLAKTVLSYNAKLPDDEGVVIAMLDAATSGRLAITYYNELLGSDFVERLAAWDETTCFPTSFHGVRPPRLRNFIDFAYGTYRSDKNYFTTDEKVFKQHMQRMLICRVENRRMPQDIIRSLVSNASRLKLYNNSTREDILHTVCAAIKKRYMDIHGEEWPMALERDKKDRSYQYGRLLAILEKMEKDTYSDGEKGRETNAIRSQHMFVQRPQAGFAQIMGKLQQGYLRRLSEGARVYYDRLIQEIVDIISELEESADKPLSETYLMGYYLQKQALYTKNEVETEEMTEKQ